MTKDDIDAVPMAAADAGLALIAGRVNVAVTYEPYISAALRDRKEFKVLYTAAERPSLISDVTIAQTQFIEKNPEVIKGMILAWNDSIQFLRENFEEGGKIIADAVGSPMDEFKTAFDGVRVYNLEENGEIFLGGYKDTFVEVGKIMHGINPNDIKKVPTPEEALAVGPLNELLKK
jgi:NitT/TauT family transport system substrate-binding protein